MINWLAYKKNPLWHLKTYQCFLKLMVSPYTNKLLMAISCPAIVQQILKVCLTTSSKNNVE